MAKLEYKTLSNRTVEKLKVEKDTVFWDHELTGFGIRVYPTGGKVYVAQARGPGGTEACHGGPARRTRRGAGASEGGLDHRAGQGGGGTVAPEPISAMKLARGSTVAELARRFLEEHVSVRCKPSTMKSTRTVVNRHIVPALGKLPLEAVSRARVMELHDELYADPCDGEPGGPHPVADVQAGR